MTVFGRVFAVVAGVLAVLALVSGNALVAVSMAGSATGVLFSTTEAGRREAERRGAFGQRLRAARGEPQGTLVVRRAAAPFPARLPRWVDVDGEARGRLAAPGEEAYPVPAGARSVVVRQPWSAGRPVVVVVPASGSAVVEV